MSGRDASKATTAVRGDSVSEIYGHQLRERREEVGLSQAELSQMAGVHRNTIRNAELGRPSEVRTLSNMLCALGCAPNVRSWDSENIPTVKPVFSTRVAGLAAKAALAIVGEDPDSEELVFQEYIELVAELSRGRILSMQFGLCNELVAQMRPLDGELFDAEVATLAPEYTVRWIDGKRTIGVPLPRTVTAEAGIAVVGTGAVGSTVAAVLPALGASVRLQESEPGAPPLSQMLAESLAGDTGLAETIMSAIDCGVPFPAIKTIAQAQISEEDRQTLMRHAMKRAAEAQQAIIEDVALLVEMTAKD